MTDKRIIAKTGLVSRNTTEMFLDKVESLHVEQSVPGRIFDFGTDHYPRHRRDRQSRSGIFPLRWMLRKQFMQAADLYRQKVK